MMTGTQHAPVASARGGPASGWQWAMNMLRFAPVAQLDRATAF